MEQGYRNKEIKKAVKDKQMITFFFPKANPPVAIEAETYEEALEKLNIKTKSHD